MRLTLQRIVLAWIGFFLIPVLYAQNNPQISVEELTYDFGTIYEADGLASHVFQVKNTGQAPLVITRVTASCGCTQPQWSKEPIAPGKSGELKITFDPKGRPGPFYKTVSIYSNGKKGSYNLAVKGTVKPKTLQPVFNYPYSIGELKLHTKTILYSTIRPDEKLEERIHILNDSQKALTIQLGKLPSFFSVEADPDVIQPGEMGTLTIVLDAAAVKRKGRVAVSLPVTVSSSDLKESQGQIQIAANIIDNFNKLTAAEKALAPVAHLSGTLLEFGQLPTKGGIIPLIGGKATISFDITNTGKSPLNIYSVTSDDERLDISGGRRELKPGATATFKVSIRPKDVKTKLESLINVVCDDPNGPVRLIKVTAYK